MLKVLETTQQRLVVEEVRSTHDAKILTVFNYSAIYLLLFFTLRLWSKLYSSNSFSEYIYDTLKHPLFTYFYVIALFLLSVALLSMLPLGSCFPTRTFIFDHTSNYLIIDWKYLFWHSKVKYSLTEIHSVQWVTKPVYTGNMIVDVQFLKLVRRKKNGKMHLIPIRYAVHSDHLETSTAITLIRRFLSD